MSVSYTHLDVYKRQGTGNTRSAFAMELVTLVFYTLFIYVAGMRLHLPVAICFLTEVVSVSYTHLVSLRYS